jgi:23S rRNA (guanosine2251-2'-O)-methyltransferase
MKKLSMDDLGRKSVSQFRDSAKHPFAVVLDNVRSLNNIGSVFRTSDAFLIEMICLCGFTGTPPHREIHKTALGAENSVLWKYFEQTRDAIHLLKSKGFLVYAVEQTSQSILLNDFNADPQQKYALVFGNELHGVEQAVIDLCDGAIEIPQFGTKHSFNIAVSAGVVLWEMYRQFSGDHSKNLGSTT